MNPAKGCDPGGGGGTANREPARRALFSWSFNTEASNGASKRLTYRLTPRVSDSALGKSRHVGSLSDPNLMYSSLQQVKSQIKDTGFKLESNRAG